MFDHYWRGDKYDQNRNVTNMTKRQIKPDYRCVAKDTGVPIFGLETNMTAAKDMTCACASQVLAATIMITMMTMTMMMCWRFLEGPPKAQVDPAPLGPKERKRKREELALYHLFAQLVKRSVH